MERIESSIDVDADAAAVWDVLADGESYPDWNPFITRLEGTLEPERRVTVRIEPPGRRGMTFRPRLKTVEPERRLAWKGSLLVPNVFDGHHEFAIEPQADGGVRLVQRETFAGLLVPLLLEEAAIEQGFWEMNQALKRRVEGGKTAGEGNEDVETPPIGVGTDPD
ncbi:SRPBCC domain-containing protein [Natronomonas marina]|jgi:hypothetical protein|uniref:SRPBCC domain-containing protein n=1 Tax=Natronomonas marina TaxID=2961939 RepID=UPI0020C9821B|nr:SRPBCC domain-containing protein [Natronomonas marina]